LNNKKKHSFWNWDLFISFTIGSIIKNVVEDSIGFKRNAFTNGFNSLNFVVDILILIICSMIIYSLFVLISRKVN
jgi:hypothetical protein